MKQWYISNFLYYCMHRARVEFGQKRNVVSFTLNLSLLIASSFSSSVFFFFVLLYLRCLKPDRIQMPTESSRLPQEEKKGRREERKWDGIFLIFRLLWELLSTCCKLEQHDTTLLSAAGSIRNVLQPNGTSRATSVGAIYVLMTWCQSNGSQIYPSPLLMTWKLMVGPVWPMTGNGRPTPLAEVCPTCAGCLPMQTSWLSLQEVKAPSLLQSQQQIYTNFCSWKIYFS